jgi:exosortase family protein XrtF
MIKEFKPTILFLVKFLAIYLIGNLIYGWWITSWHPMPDPMTIWVTEQSAWVLNVFGMDATTINQMDKPTTFIVYNKLPIVSVYEGCNGLNMGIVYLAFLLAFGPYKRTLAWFAPLGLLVIHVANLARIVMLFLVSIHMPDAFYFTHKYLFTAFIYLFVFLLWMWWVLKLAKPDSHEQTN